MKEIRHTSIIGMGALGMLYGSHILRACGTDSLTYLMDWRRLMRSRGKEYSVNGNSCFLPRAVPADVPPADLLIVAVKYPALHSILPMIKAASRPDTIILSVMNGISSEDIIARYLGRESMVYTVPQGMDAMHFGDSLRYSKMGELHLGITDERSAEDLESVCSFFDRIHMPYVREEDILYRMWFKYLLNVGINQVCMVYNTTYSGAIQPGEAHDTMIGAMREVRQIANARGIRLTEQDIQTCIDIESTLDPDATPSMGQDRINRCPSEVDMFAGTVIRLGKEAGIPTPVNEELYRKVKEIESGYVRPCCRKE